jgi:hypothetical protein
LNQFISVALAGVVGGEVYPPEIAEHSLAYQKLQIADKENLSIEKYEKRKQKAK